MASDHECVYPYDLPSCLICSAGPIKSAPESWVRAFAEMQLLMGQAIGGVARALADIVGPQAITEAIKAQEDEARTRALTRVLSNPCYSPTLVFDVETGKWWKRE